MIRCTHPTRETKLRYVWEPGTGSSRELDYEFIEMWMSLYSHEGWRFERVEDDGTERGSTGTTGSMGTVE